MGTLKPFRIGFLWLLFAIPALAGQTADPCTLPPDLRMELATHYPSAAVVTLSDLGNDDRSLFLKEHPNACPGLAAVDFYGDGKPTLALALLVRRGSVENADLLVAHQTAEGWKLKLLDAAKSSVPVVWSQPGGRYNDVYRNKTLHATRPVIVFCGYYSWAIVYSWTGTRIDKVWIMD